MEVPVMQAQKATRAAIVSRRAAVAACAMFAFRFRQRLLQLTAETTDLNPRTPDPTSLAHSLKPTTMQEHSKNTQMVRLTRRCGELNTAIQWYK